MLNELQYEQVRIEPLSKHMGTNLSVKGSGLQSGELFEVLVMDRVVEEETRNKQYSNSNRRK